MAASPRPSLPAASAEIARKFAAISGASDWLRIPAAADDALAPTTPAHILSSILLSAAAAPSPSSSSSASEPIGDQLALDAHAQQYQKSIREKYEQKLREKARSEGFSSIDELIEAKKKQSRSPSSLASPANANTNQKESNPNDSGSGPDPSSDDQPGKTKASPAATALASVRRSSKPLSSSFAKKLDQIVRLELLQNEPADRIAAIWNHYHSTKPACLSGTISPEMYARLTTRGNRYPHFVLPLPRGDGYELFLMQFAGSQIYYTPLLEYKTRGAEGAAPALVVTHYDDLAASKDIVLMVADIDTGAAATPTTNAKLTPSEAQNLVYQTQLFYVTGGDERTKLVELFATSPASFDYQDLIRAIETLSPASSS